MLVTGLVLCVFGIGFFCWLLVTLLVYALPFFAGLTAGLAAFRSGSGVIGTLVVGVLASGATLAIGQIAFATVRAAHPRRNRASLRRADCHRRLPRDVWTRPFGVPSEGWRQAFAIVGAVIVGGTAWARVLLVVPPHVDRQVAGGPASFPLAGATREG